jgi:hypothetical protein
MTKKELATLGDAALCEKCVQPAALAMRGRGPEVREQVYGALTPGQRAVFMFWVVYAHGFHGWTQVYMELPHLVGQDSFWRELKLAAKYLELRELLELTETFERHLREARAANKPISAQYDERLAKALVRDVRSVADHIRANPGTFFELRE